MGLLHRSLNVTTFFVNKLANVENLNSTVFNRIVFLCLLMGNVFDAREREKVGFLFDYVIDVVFGSKSADQILYFLHWKSMLTVVWKGGKEENSLNQYRVSYLDHNGF